MAKAVEDIRSLARVHTVEMIRVLVMVARQPKSPPAARVVAANSLLDRGWGKPAATVTGADGGDIRVVIRQIIENATQSDDEPKLIEHDEGDST